MEPEFSIYNESVEPGQYKLIHIPMPRLYDSAPLSMPVHVLRGSVDGPVLCLSSTIHGDEVNGIEIIRRVLKKKFLKKLVGTVIAIPIVNMYGFLYQDRYLMDRRDLNRCFPGLEQGSLAARLAYILTSEIIDKCTHCIDLHTGSLHRSNLPQIRADVDDKKNKELAQAFNAPIILDSQLPDGSLREYAFNKNISILVYEAGESLRFDNFSIKTGVNGILNVMYELKMLKPPKTFQKHTTSSIARSSYWVRAQNSGIINAKKKLGALVKKDEVIATIANPSNLSEHAVTCPISGIIIGQNNLPMVHEGAAIFHIATFKNISLVAEKIEHIQEIYYVDE